MFRSIFIFADQVALAAVEQLAAESRAVSLVASQNGCPTPYEIVRLMNNNDPDLVVIELADWQWPTTVQAIRAHSPETAIIGFSADSNLARSMPVAGMGLDAILANPLSPQSFLTAIHDAIHRARPLRHEGLLAFLPAKAGSGASTVTLNAAGAVAAETGKKVLVLETDLRSGVLSEVLNTPVRRAIGELLEDPHASEGIAFSSAVVRQHGIDFLLTDRVPRERLPGWSDYYHLLRSSGPRYDYIFVDLPEIVNDGTAELVSSARTVFVVCTPELQSLALARQRRQELKARGVPDGRIALVVNRWHKSDPPSKEIEEITGLPVAVVLKNDYESVRKAIAQAALVDRRGELGRSFTAFARTLTGSTGPEPKAGFGLLNLLTSKRA